MGLSSPKRWPLRPRYETAPMVCGPRITRSTNGSRPGGFFSRAMRLSTDSPKAVGTGLLMFCCAVRIWQSALLWLSPLLRNGQLDALEDQQAVGVLGQLAGRALGRQVGSHGSRGSGRPALRGQNWSGSRLL